MRALSRGENAPIPAQHMTIDVSGVRPGTVDLMVFQVTASGKVRSDDDLVFFNQPTSREGAVSLTGPSTVLVDLTRVPAMIEMLRVAVSLDDSAPGTLAAIPALGVTLGAFSAPATGLTSERAAILAEIYRRGGHWKVRNVSAGWDAGLRALVTEHGVSVDDAPPVSPPAPQPTAPRPATPPAPPRPAHDAPPPGQQPAPTRGATTPAAPPVRLTKITLSKAQPTVSLADASTAWGMMRVNLNWTQRRGILGGGGIDLDLACLYQLKNGDKGVIQALGNSFGDLKNPPYICLDGDDRTGQVAGGENLHISLDHLDEFKRILIFAYIYEGSTNWSAANGVVTIFPTSGQQVEIKLDSHDNRARSCAIALLKIEKGKLNVTREIRYINGSQDAVSRAYRWGLTWTPGKK